MRIAKENSNSQATEPRIIAKIKKVFYMYPKIYRELEGEACRKLRNLGGDRGKLADLNVDGSGNGLSGCD